MKYVLLAALMAPTCWNTSQTCLDAWYQYGDQTGDYGVIDAEVSNGL
jgi:hypothetical protein